MRNEVCVSMEWQLTGHTCLGEGVCSTTAAAELQAINSLGDCCHAQYGCAAQRLIAMSPAGAQPGRLQRRADAARAHASSRVPRSNA